ncbi:hypothetical protein [Thermomonas sp.]|uniref:hypothetical protein n=1 Tax=Thermomonas sp. TaxID=1971895 RepID=UPI00248A5D3D|nr:hypothetical protein [Thermomonas sp.]MDI1253843.1 hypothetical protein [Thermomonas sp.]
MDWNDISADAREVMQELGNFGPTFHPGDRQVKGFMIDSDGDAGKTYWDSNELRRVAAACNEVAAWLDKRAGVE